ncbi:MAG: glycosyltransferase family 4 protein [Ruminococcus sp.]|uniref:glycosyltransferase family 4 protein n=1 Tax=Ruminococcus sp. TaxID=41978 RepID=UPI0025D8D53A|nr:glycosyltransferase family 4 protein [Ruminococcus sp.]MCR5601012.1 glycosyltransferase family 4 protein [Ruminococcus sp.]
MKVLVIGRAYPEVSTGMNGIFEYEQASGLRKMKLNVSYIWSDVRSIKYQKKIKKTEKVENGIRLVGYNLPIGGISAKILHRIQMFLLKKAFKDAMIAAGTPDVVHIHFPLLTVDTEFIKYVKSLGCKVVVTEHWTRILEKRITDAQAKTLKDIAEEADSIICVSEDLKNSVADYIDPKNCDKLIVIPNMVAECFSYHENKNSDGKFVFLYSGRLRKPKRCDLLIKAFEKAFPNKNEKVELIIAGDGLEREALEKLKEEYHDSRIVFKGFVKREKMSELYRKADIYVSASALETFGVPFAEAWMCGRPVICADNSPILPYLEEMKNGISFKTDDVESLKTALLTMYEKCSSFDGKAISEKASEIFSQQAVITKVKDVLK